MGIITYDEKSFLRDGRKHVIRSGAMHYFRIPRAYWDDRLEKLKECGFNTVETYTCWNLHEPEEGKFDFGGMLDIAAYVDLAREKGLDVILRPGPYICAEWEFGGLPSWLLKYDDLAIRCNDPGYLEKVGRYYSALFDQLRPRLATNGGNIVMVQVENEYGSYGDDQDYLRAILDIYRACGVDVTLFTSDGESKWMLSGGTLPGVLSVVNFGSRYEEAFKSLKEFRPDEPTMCGEFWCGWFDHWYEEHHGAQRPELPDLYRGMLEMGASVNFYMFYGGTNFGFTSGANHYDQYQPTITSYDYGALLTEAGDFTPSYHAIRKVHQDLFGDVPALTAGDCQKGAYGKVVLAEKASLLDSVRDISTPVHAAAPKFQEYIGQKYGFTLYSSVVRGPIEELPLIFDALHDRAVIYINGERKGIRERSRRMDEVTLKLADGESARLDILLENMGRVNYGPKLRDHKGITGIRLGQRYHFGWDMYPVTLEDISGVKYAPCAGGVSESSFLRGTLTITGAPKDTFIKLDGFHRGVVLVNGFNLGRYYLDAGPQKTLYCPAPVLRPGANEVVVFETDGSDTNVIEFVDTPDLG